MKCIIQVDKYQICVAFPVKNTDTENKLITDVIK